MGGEGSAPSSSLPQGQTISVNSDNSKSQGPSKQGCCKI